MNRLTKHIKYEGENNMKFKKRLAVLLVLVMIISLAVGCTANSPTKDTSADSNDSTNATASADNLTNNADSSSANTVRIGVLLPFTGGSGMNRSLLQGVAVMALAAAAFAVTAIHRKKKNHS